LFAFLLCIARTRCVTAIEYAILYFVGPASRKCIITRSTTSRDLRACTVSGPATGQSSPHFFSTFCTLVNDNLKANSEANNQLIADHFYHRAMGTPRSIDPRSKAYSQTYASFEEKGGGSRAPNTRRQKPSIIWERDVIRSSSDALVGLPRSRRTFGEHHERELDCRRLWRRHEVLRSVGPGRALAL
jgi:hypothetical protein